MGAGGRRGLLVGGGGGGGLQGTPNTSFTGPTLGNAQAMIYTGTTVIIVNRAGDGTEYDVEFPYTATGVTYSFPGTFVLGATLHDGNFMIADRASNTVYVMSGMTDTTDSSVDMDLGTSTLTIIGGITTIGGDLIGHEQAGQGGEGIYTFDGISNTQLDYFVFGSAVSEISNDGSGNLISSNDTVDEVYLHDGVSDTILSTISSPSDRVNGVMWDGVNLWTIDIVTHVVRIHDGFSAFVP